MKVELSLDEKAGPLPVLAAIDIVVLILVLGFVITGIAHRSGLPVTLGLSQFRVAVDQESVVLTVKGAAEPVLYSDSKPVEEGDLAVSLRTLRTEEGIQMVVVKGDLRLSAQAQSRFSELVLNEGLECVWLAEADLSAP